ncbi:hypothetical protein [Nonomuraea sp. NPDC049750]|uniref:hypothetical protein n=1 Tax=Nonomuraea sp. NPDC049750 TaxID=3154738 RepID=UPI0033EFC108
MSKLIADGSGQTVNAVGSALLQVRFDQADGHDRHDKVTYGPIRRTYALPGVIQHACGHTFPTSMFIRRCADRA